MPVSPNRVDTGRLPDATPWKFDVLLLALFLIIQIGYSYWISIATLAAVLMLVRLRHQLTTGLRHYPWLLGLPLVMFAPFAFERSIDYEQDILRTGREAVVACLMFATIAGTGLHPPQFNIRRITWFVTILVIFLLGLTCVQFVLLRRGIYFGFPEEAFATELGTIPGTLDLIYSNLRPAATFGEPSYLAFITLSLLLILAAVFDRERKGWVPALMAVLTGLLSQAASFVLSAGIIGGVFGLRTTRGRYKIFVVTLLTIAAMAAIWLVVTVFSNDLMVIERLQRSGGLAADSSIFSRIFGPMNALPYYLSQHPLGLPQSMVIYGVGPYAVIFGIDPAQYLMNGLFNLMFQYGYLGLVVVLVPLVRRDAIISIYLLSCMMFNGSFLATDKIAVICLTIAFYHAVGHQSRPIADDRLVTTPSPS